MINPPFSVLGVEFFSMGDLEAWIPQSNGSMGDYDPPLSPSQPSNPHPSAIRAESWRQAEQATQEIIERIQPTLVSEHRRRAVIEYVQKLVRGLLITEVLPFGSVPLKTYLPDGDIDLTALGVPNYEDALASEVRSALEGEERNKDAEFEVKDVQYIHAEVRLVKCLVQNIVVDISFNQIGGLCTLCFLEQVDRYIGKNNLYKRSIILIKAWCYYESRILGAHHGLISTYALETLVLYIFHLFHSSLDGPLAVLYRFLDYYSKFDWDNYCVSLHGPISVSSLPELLAEAPENDGDDLLISKEFLGNCVNMFSDPPRGLENNSRNFPQKHLNIVDPLKESNNLGRSISKGNFYRIRSAFTYGARKLGRLLSLPAESIADEIDVFFMNTLDRHGSGVRPDVQDGLPSSPDSAVSNHHGIGSASSEFKVEGSKEGKSTSGTSTTDSNGTLCEEISNLSLSCLDQENGTQTQLHRHPSDHQQDASFPRKYTKMESNGLVEGNGGDLATINETCKASPSNSETCGSPSGTDYCAPRHFFDTEDRIGNGISATGLTPNGEIRNFIQPESYEAESLARYEGIGNNGSPKLDNLVDLCGDYDMQLRSLLYAQWCREYLLGTLFLPVHQTTPSQYRNKYSWDAVRRRNTYTHVNANGMVPGPPFPHPGCYLINPPLMSGAYGMEDMPKPRGTGTYFPNANYRAYKERQSPGRGRNLVPNHMSRPRNNGRADMNIHENGNHDPSSQAQISVSIRNDRGRPALLEVPKSSQTSSKGFAHANGILHPSDRKVEFGSFGPVPLGTSSSEAGRRLESVHSQGSGSVSPASNVQRSATSSNPERSRQTYQLKNDDDFPPLTG